LLRWRLGNDGEVVMDQVLGLVYSQFCFCVLLLAFCCVQFACFVLLFAVD